MKLSRRLIVISVSICLLFTLAHAASMQQRSNTPRPLRPGETWVNPKPGITAPGSTKNRTRAVTASRGYGDASLSYFLNSVMGWADTYLNNVVQNPHYICARAKELTDQSVIVAVNSTPTCGTFQYGGHVQSSVGPVLVACGHGVIVNSNHSIYRAGKYNWNQDDFDGFTFCG